MSKRPLAVAGLVVAGGVGYYLYAAGGDPKVGLKQFEADATKATSSIRSHLPGEAKEARKEVDATVDRFGARIDTAVDDARSKLTEAEKQAEQWKKDGSAKFDQVRKETGESLTSAVDAFDKTVEKKSSEAKSGISSWFSRGSK